MLLTAALAASLLTGCASRRDGGVDARRSRAGTRQAPSDCAHSSFVRARRLVGLGRIAEASRVLERLVDEAPHYIPAHRLYQDVLVESVSDWNVRRRYAERLGVRELLYPDRRLEAFARNEGIPFLMLVPPLRAWAEAHQTCVHGFPGRWPCEGHWNEHGHRLAGRRIAEKLCSEVLATGATATPSSPAAGAR